MNHSCTKDAKHFSYMLEKKCLVQNVFLWGGWKPTNLTSAFNICINAVSVVPSGGKTDVCRANTDVIWVGFHPLFSLSLAQQRNLMSQGQRKKGFFKSLKSECHGRRFRRLSGIGFSRSQQESTENVGRPGRFRQQHQVTTFLQLNVHNLDCLSLEGLPSLV